MPILLKLLQAGLSGAVLTCGFLVPEFVWAGAPVIVAVSPTPGVIRELTSIGVTFDQSVTGIRADDFLINGVPALGMSGSGTAFTFTFAQPTYGPVDVSWGTLHQIASLVNPAERFDGGASESVWSYQLVNPQGPQISTILPGPGTTLRQIAEVELAFDEPVVGVDATDLRLNGVPALHMVGVGRGPYRFSFAAAGPGEVVLSWNPMPGILSDDASPLSFAGSDWTYTVRPEQLAPDVIINEILAENQSGLVDEDKDPEDWIELYNRGAQAVNLEGWSLSVDREDASQWMFPEVQLPAGGYLVIWASGKDRRDPGTGKRLHTNFKLNPNGDTLRLFGPELPRAVVDELAFPEQAPDHSYARQTGGGTNFWAYSAEATPGGANQVSALLGKVDEVHFSVPRGYFNSSFSLNLACATPGAEIRYTLDGSKPSLTNGFVFAAPIPVATNRVVRASAFAAQRLPARVRTHTYLMNIPANRRTLPVLSLVTATNNLYGRTGIMEFNPRNTTKHGAAWERPVSVEWIRPEDNGGFQIDAGLRVAGGDYIRGRYNYRTTAPPEGKYSFRLYFRGEYGPGRLNYAVFPQSTVKSFNGLHLRAGMNDPTNPFIKDEFVRALSLDVGIPACHGTFVHLFLNGVYKGLYNPAERVDDDFLQAYQGGGELWDVVGPNNEPIRGDLNAWNQLRTAARKNLTIKTNYLDVAARMDLVNFIDYLLPLIWADNDDWPYNNTRAAREKIPGSKFRFFPWDAEFAFTSHSFSYDTIARTLSNASPPWGTSDYAAIFNSLKKTSEFRLLFADRVHRAFFNDGPLTDAHIRAHYTAIKTQVAPAISGFNDVIGSWITNRRRYLTNSFDKAGFLASSNAPVASQFGGFVPSGYALVLKNLVGDIFYTTNGVDPRVPFDAIPTSNARLYAQPLLIQEPVRVLARSLDGTNWSALVDMTFELNRTGSAIRFTEIMYNPLGGDAFEYIELQNTGALPLDLSGYSFSGIQFRFPASSPLVAPGAHVLLANESQPADFRKRYPGVDVVGWFAGALDNGGERLGLLDPSGRLVAAAEYRDDCPWPREADSAGASLELVDLLADPSNPAAWEASRSGGTPGAPNALPAGSLLRINELQAGTSRDWIELFNAGTAAVDIGGWSLTDDSDPRRFVFPAGTSILPGGYVEVECQRGQDRSALTASFALDRRGETVALFDARTNRVDVVQYGPVVDGFTVGRQEDGHLVLCQPTPLAPNQPTEMAPITSVRLNEFVANPDAGDDWMELFNFAALPVALEGTMVVTSNETARVTCPTFLGPGAFLVLWADRKATPGHLDLKLAAAGGSLSFRDSAGEKIDEVAYGPQLAGHSSGRWPDGQGAFQLATLRPTPGSPNELPALGTRLQLTEVMARAKSGLDWVELENTSGAPFSLAGFSLGVEPSGQESVRWPFRTDLQLQPGQRIVATLGGTNLVPGAISPAQLFPVPLPDEGATLTVWDATGHLLDEVAYGPQIIDRSIGRSSSGWELLAKPSPGQPNGAAAALDTGLKIRLNEWLAGGGGTNDFVELYNAAALPVELSGWVLTDDPSISGSTNRQLPALTFLDANAFLTWHTDGEKAVSGDHLPFQLDRFGETIRLLNASGAIIDSVDFPMQSAGVSEGRYPDADNQIVRFVNSMSPGASNYLLPGDVDHDGMDDAWELLHGFDPTTPSDAHLDSDNDGADNRAEFVAQTDPHNASSSFRLTMIATTAGERVLRFYSTAGLSYRLQACDDLAASEWNEIAHLPASASSSVVEVADPGARFLRSARFYRVEINP